MNGYYWPSKRVWKKVESQGKVSEKSGNFDTDIEWQPCDRRQETQIDTQAKKKYTVKIMLTTTRIEGPPVFNDYFETLPTIYTIICH